MTVCSSANRRDFYYLSANMQMHNTLRGLMISSFDCEIWPREAAKFWEYSSLSQRPSVGKGIKCLGSG